MPTILLKINKPFDGYAPGGTVKVEVDENGEAIKNEWRRRIKDAELDQCCEKIEVPANQKPSKQKQKSKSKDHSETE